MAFSRIRPCRGKRTLETVRDLNLTSMPNSALQSMDIVGIAQAKLNSWHMKTDTVSFKAIMIDAIKAMVELPRLREIWIIVVELVEATNVVLLIITPGLPAASTPGLTRYQIQNSLLPTIK